MTSTGSPAAPPPPADAKYTIAQVARLSGVPIATIRYYVAHDAVPAPEFHSRHTRYDASFLVRLRAVAALRRQKLRIPTIRAQLADASPEELLSLAGYTSPDSPSHAGSPPRSAADSPPRPLPPGFVGAYRGAGHPTERWEHMEVCPGVKLLVRSEADAEAWRVAREVMALFAAPRTPA